MTWISPTPTETDGPLTGPDRPMLEAELDYQRATLLNICAGLTAEQLAERPIPSTNLSLLGLVRHMAKVERIWFRKRTAEQDIEHLHNFEARDDTDFVVIDASDAERAMAQLVEEQGLARAAVSDLDFDLAVDDGHGDRLSLRRVHVHMISEYARHNGHADLLRQAIDGATSR
ncbi:Mini-circle protein [Aeromicrobium sp. A1-2]|uniref:DinB family protein n=1 Tax=Aeromicrobium sp. A1-2 TaxID=2107713 RepID=UPI000E483872|nr:DinB family protein [Aeromicrobium sp. A1-2]AXT85696.1 Mini-circle protein [Aeromicrobium sp. A1-2]